MDISGATIMILGGSGLVGHAVARSLLACGPRRLVLVALTKRETAESATALAPHAGETAIVAEPGNVYLPASLAQADRWALREERAVPKLAELALFVSGVFQRRAVAVRVAAVHAFAAIDTPDARAQLERHRDDSVPEVRAAVLQAVS